MERKKDIGELLEQKFQQFETSTDAALWGRIEKTLDKKEKRKRRFFFILFGSLGIGLISLIGLALNTDDSDAISEENTENHLTKDAQTPRNKKTEENTSLANSEEINSEINDTSEVEEPSQSAIERIGKKAKSKTRKGNIFPDSFSEANTTYYYYKSGEDKEIITKDKTVVDSIMDASKVNFESDVPMKKKDSLR